MWWDPKGEREQVLASDVRLLRNWLAERADESLPKLAFGVGSVWSAYEGGLVPFVLLNNVHFPTSALFAQPAPIDSFHRGSAREIRIIGNLPVTRMPLHVAVATEPEEASTSLADLPQVCVQRLMTEFVQFREPLVCLASEKEGTAGVVVWDNKAGRLALLTAGHVFPNGVGSQVGMRHFPYRRWKKHLSTIDRDFGTVTHHVAPAAGGKNWDAAVIGLNENARRPAAPMVWKKYERFEEPQTVCVHGATSRLVTDAAVQSALTDLGKWRNCWMIAPSGLLTGGDSGAAVFLEHEPSLLGMYVARSQLPVPKLPLFHYVQDAFTLEKEVLSKWDVSFNIGA